MSSELIKFIRVSEIVSGVRLLPQAALTQLWHGGCLSAPTRLIIKVLDHLSSRGTVLTTLTLGSEFFNNRFRGFHLHLFMPRVETPSLDPMLDQVCCLKYLGQGHDPIRRFFFLCDLIGVLDRGNQDFLLKL